MRMDFQLNSGVTLLLDSGLAPDQTYPTAKIRKGLVMVYEGQVLCEEAVGFGLPILKRGLQAIFPGEIELTPAINSLAYEVRARYRLNLEERIKKAGASTLQSPILYRCKNALAALMRRLPFMRTLLSGASSLLRSTLEWETTYEPTNESDFVTLIYAADPHRGIIRVTLESIEQRQPGVTEIIVMNEQGARFFERYQDAEGASLHGDEIGCWDEVKARQAKFICPALGLAFSLAQADHARLYRGRELIGARLAWAGFGYTLAPPQDHFSYEITVSKLL
ncbi:MAG: hypothetical protein ACM3H7_04250 [Acidobacteriaceae bacterium]